MDGKNNAELVSYLSNDVLNGVSSLVKHARDSKLLVQHEEDSYES